MREEVKFSTKEKTKDKPNKRRELSSDILCLREAKQWVAPEKLA